MPEERSGQQTDERSWASRRRDKPQLSCNLCRRRKLRCDRAQPCGTCVSRGLSLSCTYVNRPAAAATSSQRMDSAQGSSAPGGPGGAWPASIPDRLGQLERLVTSLMSSLESSASVKPGAPPEQISGAPSTGGGMDVESSSSSEPEGPPGTPDPSRLSDRFGRMSVGATKTTYVESTHWTAILDGIAELKDYFQDEPDHAGYQEFAPPVPEGDPPELLFSQYLPATKQEILAAIPPRPMLDRLVAEYLSHKAIAPIIVHSPTFLKEYERFWDSPLATPTMWLGMLFGVMCLAAAYRRDPIPMLPASKRLVQIYREKLMQCMALGGYTKCVPYTIETLLLYLHVEYLRSEDTQIETWILLGVIVRLALRMGYHRDASHFPHISVFQGEMRRRTWALIFQFDALASAQVGLPRMIREKQCDAAEPRNLLEDDLEESMTALPPARPDTFQTSVQYIVGKNTIVAVYINISDMTTSPWPPSYADVMSADKTLATTYASLPTTLHIRPISESLRDTPDTIIRRIYIALLLQKAKCTLHYRYMPLGRTDARYAYSRWACVEAALQTLGYQRILHEETQMGGRLYNDRWKVSSLVKSNFFLATTLLCLELEYDLTAEASGNVERTCDEEDRRQQIIPALYESYAIWTQLSDTSQEARKASQVLRVVLGKVHASQTGPAMMPETLHLPNSSPTAQHNLSYSRTDTSYDMNSLPTPHGSDSSASNRDTAPATPMSFHMLLKTNSDANIDYSDVSPDHLNLSQHVDEMLGMDAHFPEIFNFPV
ncbi:fungal-specific transcription factor domain-containing protein [Lipomyces orientalis]|uniref:Fungal-specific transcription factor domain-containing protein n=1 Tax=Lipomyces orientalis TaxID=1233043 RepID=A0ACC3TI51_9ASCO